MSWSWARTWVWLWRSSWWRCGKISQLTPSLNCRRLLKALVWPVINVKHRHWRKKKKGRIQAFENKCIRKLLRIPRTNLQTTDQVYKMARTESELLIRIKSRKLRYFGRVMRIPYDKRWSQRDARPCGRSEKPQLKTWDFRVDIIIAWTGQSASKTEGVGRH